MREELGRERLVSFFSTADELAQKVGVAVTNHYPYQLVGGLPSVAVVRAWTIPTPVSSFTGRDEQLVRLRTQLTDRGAATLVPTAALYGMGGVGKPSWRWPTRNATVTIMSLAGGSLPRPDSGYSARLPNSGRC